MNTKEVVSEIIGMYEDMVNLKAENAKLRNDANDLKSALSKATGCQEVVDENEYLKLKFFNNIVKSISWFKNDIINEYSLPSVYGGKDEEKHTIPFEKWLTFINTSDIEDKILCFMSVDEVINLFRSQFEEVYNEKVAKFKKDNQ